MAPRKPVSSAQPRIPVDPNLVFVGDVRQTPIEVQEDGRRFRPDVAIWVRANDGQVVGHFLAPPGQPATAMIEALMQAIGSPDHPEHSKLPGRIVVFNERLADELRLQLASLQIRVDVVPRVDDFDAIFANLFAFLEREQAVGGTIDLPDEILRSLLAAAGRLWRAKPWTFMYDHPPVGVFSRRPGDPPLYAAVLGADGLVFGVSFYTSLDDYEETVAVGPTLPPGPEDELEGAADVAQRIRHPTFLMFFNRKDEAPTAYRDQLARNGWSRRLSVVPVFGRLGGGTEPDHPTSDEASRTAVAIDALTAFSEKLRAQLADWVRPLRSTVDVTLGGETIPVDVSVPPDDAPGAPPSTVFRLRADLIGHDVWRIIDIRSNQTLEDLHDVLQDAFEWDDDHLYAFFLSGKRWDRSTEYVPPEALWPGGAGERTTRIRLSRLNLRPRKRFLYLFDFGDEWTCNIRVEKVGLKADDGEYPRIVEEHGTPPPQYPDWDDDDSWDDGEDDEDSTT